MAAKWLERRLEKTPTVIALLAKAMEPAQDLAWPEQHSGKKAGMLDVENNSNKCLFGEVGSVVLVALISSAGGAAYIFMSPGFETKIPKPGVMLGLAMPRCGSNSTNRAAILRYSW